MKKNGWLGYLFYLCAYSLASNSFFLLRFDLVFLAQEQGLITKLPQHLVDIPAHSYYRQKNPQKIHKTLAFYAY